MIGLVEVAPIPRGYWPGPNRRIQQGDIVRVPSGFHGIVSGVSREGQIAVVHIDTYRGREEAICPVEQLIWVL